MDTRRTAVFEELVPADADEEAVAAVVGKLAAEGVRLVTTSGVEGDEAMTAEGMAAAQTTVTLAHEKLIDAWPWLRQLVDENREIIALQNQINSRAHDWARRRGRRFPLSWGAVCYKSKRIWQALQPNLDELSLRFIQASIDQKQREIDEKEAQRRHTLKILGGATAVALGLATIAIFFFLQSTANARTAEANLDRANLALNAEATAILEAETNLAIATRNLATAEAAKATSTFNEGKAETQATLAASNLATAEAAKATAEAERAVALVQGERALAQSFLANSRALVADQPTSQELAQARLLAVEGARLNARVGSPAEITSSDRLLFSLAYAQPIPFQPAKRLSDHSDWVNSVAWNGDGSRLASASYDNTVIIWDTASWQPLTTLTDHTAAVNSVAWNGDGSRLASASSMTTRSSSGIRRAGSRSRPSREHTVAGSIVWPGTGTAAAWPPPRMTTRSSSGIRRAGSRSRPSATTRTLSWSVAWNGDGSRLASAS